MFERLRIKRKLALYSTALIVAALVIALVGIAGTLHMNQEYQEILQVSINNTNIRIMVEKHLEIQVNLLHAAFF